MTPTEQQDRFTRELQVSPYLRQPKRDEIKARVERIVDDIDYLDTMLCSGARLDLERLNASHEIGQAWRDMLGHFMMPLINDRDRTMEVFDCAHQSTEEAISQLFHAAEEAKPLDTSHDAPGPNPASLSAEQLCDLRRGR